MKSCINCGRGNLKRSEYCDDLCWEACNAGWPRKDYKWPKGCEVIKKDNPDLNDIPEKEEEEEEEEEAPKSQGSSTAA